MRPGRKRQLVDEARTEWKVSIRRACEVVGAVRSTYHYRSVRPDQASLRKRIREIAEARVRFGYRRIYVLLYREVYYADEGGKHIYPAWLTDPALFKSMKFLLGLYNATKVGGLSPPAAASAIKTLLP